MEEEVQSRSSSESEIEEQKTTLESVRHFEEVKDAPMKLSNPMFITQKKRHSMSLWRDASLHPRELCEKVDGQKADIFQILMPW